MWTTSMCYVMWRCYYYCLTDINHFEIVGFQMKFHAFFIEKNKQKCLYHTKWFGWVFCFVKMSWKIFHQKKMEKPTYSKNVCTHKGCAIILRRAIFSPFHNIQNEWKNNEKKRQKSRDYGLSVVYIPHFFVLSFCGYTLCKTKCSVSYIFYQETPFGWMLCVRLTVFLCLWYSKNFFLSHALSLPLSLALSRKLTVCDVISS